MFARLKISRRTALIVAALVLLLAVTGTTVLALSPAEPPAKALVYSDLLKAMDAREVASAELSPDRSSLHVELRDGREADLAFPPDAVPYGELAFWSTEAALRDLLGTQQDRNGAPASS